MSSIATVREVPEARFREDVVEASRSRPVVVDFWAPWCGPCHQLSPMLEAAANQWAGEVDVVKVNVDEAPNLARAFQVQGIPAVKAFRDGAVVAQFTGVQPPQVIEQLFASLAPSQADRLAAAARTAEAPEERERLYRAALDEQPDQPEAVVGLARMLAGRGEREDAEALLARVPADQEARRLAAELALTDGHLAQADLDDLRAKAATGDGGARFELGRALAAAGQYDEAFELLLEAVRDPDRREEARAAVLDVFQLLGADDPRVRAWRPRLAAALF